MGAFSILRTSLLRIRFPRIRLRSHGRAWLVGGLALAPWLLAGCYVNVDKNKNGDDKNVTIHTPMGGLHVQQNGTTPQDIGLAAYPGATVVNDKDGSNSADVNLGFGSFQLRVRAAKYQTTDAAAKVTGFYRTALAQYGTVLECRNGKAVGSPAVTAEGLSCDDKGAHGKGFHLSEDEGDHDLRAGSKRHQHIVGIAANGSGTRFTLLQVDLPAGLEQGDKEE